MIKITTDDNSKKATIKNMSRGDIFIYHNYYYMYINSDTIVRLPDFVVWDPNYLPDIEYIIYNAEIIIHK